jgi:hypothetical protein
MVPVPGLCVLGSSHLAFASCLEIIMLLLCTTNLLCSFFVENDSTNTWEEDKKELTLVLESLSGNDSDDSAELVSAVVKADDEIPMKGSETEIPPGGKVNKIPNEGIPMKGSGTEIPPGGEGIENFPKRKKIPMKKDVEKPRDDPGASVAVVLFKGGSRKVVKTANKHRQANCKTAARKGRKATRQFKLNGFGRSHVARNPVVSPRGCDELARFETKWSVSCDTKLIDALLCASGKIHSTGVSVMHTTDIHQFVDLALENAEVAFATLVLTFVTLWGRARGCKLNILMHFLVTMIRSTVSAPQGQGRSSGLFPNIWTKFAASVLSICVAFSVPYGHEK